MATLFIHVDAKIDVVVSKFISILPVPKTGITETPVDNTRNFFSYLFEEFSEYPNKNCLVFSSSALGLSWKIKVFRTLVAVNFSNSSSKWSMLCFISSRKPRISRPLAYCSRAIFRRPITSCMMRFCIISILFLFLNINRNLNHFKYNKLGHIGISHRTDSRLKHATKLRAFL